MPVTHAHIPDDLQFARTAHEERHLLEAVQVPIVTVSATFKEQIEEIIGEKPTADIQDVTFSRAHYSMANALVVAATKKKKTFWMVDPTNYVSAKDWPKILFTQRMGRIIARNPLLKELKDLMDTRLRNQLPLTAAIREPLTYVFHRVTRPIISLHYEAGNILLENGKKVVQVVTDPHVRPQYLTHADNPHLIWTVFDDKTKAELIELGYILGHTIKESRVVVAGCPVDPRIETKDRNSAVTGYKRRPLRLAITTGGLGTNKDEIEKLLESITPLVRKKEVQLACFAGVHPDFDSMFRTYAKNHRIPVGQNDDPHAPLRIFFGHDVIDSNELLLDHIFPWADGFVTKPSGDMAYEAVAAGCFLITLRPWGEWEENIRSYFEQMRISVRCRPNNFASQITALTTMPVSDGKPWVEIALERAHRFQKPLAQGAYNILTVQNLVSRAFT